VIMFSRANRGGASHLWTVDVTGANAQPAPYSLPASDPAWSPLLN
jgi:TolB protein